MAKVLRAMKPKKCYSCYFCSAETTAKHLLENHIRVHTGEKPHKCNFCGKCFSIAGNRNQHMKVVHLGERRYKCSFCAKSFGTSQTLKLHINTHTHEKPFKCLICGISFSSHSSLWQHKKVHTNEKPFMCQVCGRCFREKKHLRMHNLNIHVRGESLKNQDSNKSSEANCKVNLDIPSKSCQSLPIKTVEENVGKDSKPKSETESQEEVKNVPISCKVCKLVISSEEEICRHYSLRHRLPRVALSELEMKISGIKIHGEIQSFRFKLRNVDQ